MSNFQFIELQTFISPHTHSICHKSPVLTTPSIVLCTCRSLKPHTQRNDNSFGFDFFFSHTLHFRLCAKKADFSPFTLKRQGVQGVELQSKLNWMFVKQSPPPALWLSKCRAQSKLFTPSLHFIFHSMSGALAVVTKAFHLTVIFLRIRQSGWRAGWRNWASFCMLRIQPRGTSPISPHKWPKAM